MTWATRVCMMQIPGRNWSATSWFQYLAVHGIIHFASYIASPFWWTASSHMYCLDADCVIHCMLRVATSLLKAAKSQKQWKVYKLGPTPDLLKQSKLTILTVTFVFSAWKLVKTCYFNLQSILTVDQCNHQYSLKLLAATSTGVLSHQLNIAWMTTFSSHLTGMKNEPSRIETFLEQAVQDQLYLSTTRALLHSILPPVQLVFEHFNPRLKSPICFNHSHNSPSCPAFNIGRITIWKYSHSLEI